jgi:hypothetical protein
MGVWIHVPIIKVKLTESRLLDDAQAPGFVRSAEGVRIRPYCSVETHIALG